MVSDKKRIPLACLAIHVIFEKNRIRRFVRFLPEDHVSFFRCIIAFLRIALLAGSDQVCPGINTTASTGHDMIDRQVFPGATVLTLMVVALEYILPGKINALVRGVNISIQAYYR